MAHHGADAAASPAPDAAHAANVADADQRTLFGLSDDTSSGNQWQGSQYTASTRVYKKWWPAVYPGEWKLPTNGMRYPFIWKLETVRVECQTAYESWTWEWIETPDMPSIAQVEQMLRTHAREQEERRRAAAATADSSAGPSQPS